MNLTSIEAITSFMERTYFLLQIQGCDNILVILKAAINLLTSLLHVKESLLMSNIFSRSASARFSFSSCLNRRQSLITPFTPV